MAGFSSGRYISSCGAATVSPPGNMAFMRIFKWLIALSFLAGPLASPPAFAIDGPASATDNVKSRLVSETRSIGPGQTVWVALELNIRDGWHTYWRNTRESRQGPNL